MLTWMNGSSTTPPVYLPFRSSKFFIIASVAAAVFTDLFLYGVIVPVIPFALTTRAGIAEEDVQTWVSILLAVYGGALLFCSPLCGWYADRSSSRRGPLLLGLLALAGATAILTVGSSVGVLIAGRLLQGTSAAVVWVVGLALVADTMGPDGVGEALGYIGLSMSFGILLSPLIGGIVFERAGYYAVFGVSFALLGVDIVLRLALVEKKVAKRWIEVDESKEKSDEADEAQTGGVQDTQVEETAAPDKAKEHSLARDEEASSPATTSSAPAEQSNTASPPTKSRLPILLVLLSSRRLLSACLGTLIQALILTSFDSTIPIFVRNTFHWTSLGAGLVFLPVALPSFLAPFIGSLSDRFGARYLATAGYISACPIIILLRLVNHDSLRQKVLLCALLALLGVSVNLQLTPIMAEITYAVEATVQKRPKGFLGDKGAYAQAYGLFNMAFAGGSMLGPLLGGLVTQSAGWNVSTLVLGIISGVWAIPIFWWTGGSLRRKRRAEANAVE